MATSKIILDDAELAKNYVINSDMSDEYKRTYLRLINISTLATNGITPEQKIQKMTECIQLLAITQVMYIVDMDKRLNTNIDSKIEDKCKTCKAVQYVDNIEQEQHDKDLIENYISSSHIEDKTVSKEDMSWMHVLKTILTKPYIYVVFALMMISPYSVEIVKTICQFIGSGK